MSIRPIAADSVRRIVAGQAVTDLASAVKELLDNAIDAGSENINIRLFQQGLQIVEVSDDGIGVPPESRRLLATPHATSKIQCTDDIGRSLGFRGEALFSLATISEKLIVATRVQGEDLAEKLEFRRDGTVDEACVIRFPKKVGTTVAVVGLFAALPVRRGDLKQRLSQQRAKLLSLVEAYAIFHPGIKIHLMDMVGRKCREQTLVATAFNANNLRETISSVLGPKFLDMLCSVEITHERVQVSGMLSKAACAVSTTRKLIAVNRRPVELPKLSRSLNALWKQRGFSREPSWCLSLTVPIQEVDVNLTPDKRTIMLTHESVILQVILSHVEGLWASQSNGSFVSEQTRGQRVDVDYDSPALSDDELENDDSSSPSRFNRRYAFSHDVSKARLQHEFDDGRTRLAAVDDPSLPTEVPERDTTLKAPEAEPNVRATEHHQSEVAMHVEPLSQAGKRLKQQQLGFTTKSDLSDSTRVEHVTPSPVGALASDTPASNGSIGTPSSATNRDVSQLQALQDTRPLSADDSVSTPGMSSEERSQWRRMQQIFNRSSGIEEDIQVAESRGSTEASRFNFAQFGLNQPVVDMPKPLGLSTPAYGSSKRLVSDEEYQETETCSMPIPQRSKATRELSSVASQIPNQEKSLPLVRNAPESGDDDDEDDDDGVMSSQATSADDPENPRPPQATDPPDNAVSRRPEIVWDSFGTTKEVILAAKRERVAMRDRKRTFQEYTNGSHDREGVIRLSNQDFAGMEVIGQFNLGFILARSHDNHLWILDQHACDEKYNFERLCEETVIHEQRLIAPMPLELTPAEELCVMDHIDIFEKNGFRFLVDLDKPTRHRLALTALPQSGARDGRKAVLFGKDDVSALCTMLGADDSSVADVTAGGGTGVDGSGMYGNNAVRRYAGSGGTDNADKIIARLPKAIAMFASRACRSSIMIGKALSSREMERIVHRMKDLKDAWSCPHGRPTMRHVTDLQPRLIADERKAQERIAGATVALSTQEEEVSDSEE